MRKVYHPHVLGIDDGPFKKGVSKVTPIVGVMMEGKQLIEGVVVTEFPIDGDGATEFLAAWVKRTRFHRALQGVILGGVTIAGLGVIDVRALAADLGSPVLIVNRRDPARHRLREAFAAAGLLSRLSVVETTPPAFRISEGLYVAAAGVERTPAARLLRATLGKSDLPEPLRVAHLIARAIVTGESRGRP
jgi:endonuclease V-like protein UPF0215 family